MYYDPFAGTQGTIACEEPKEPNRESRSAIVMNRRLSDSLLGRLSIFQPLPHRVCHESRQCAPEVVKVFAPRQERRSAAPVPRDRAAQVGYSLLQHRDRQSPYAVVVQHSGGAFGVFARAVRAQVEPDRREVSLGDARFLTVGIRLQPRDPTAGATPFCWRPFRGFRHRIDSEKLRRTHRGET
jgi:hypothetical protein